MRTLHDHRRTGARAQYHAAHDSVRRLGITPEYLDPTKPCFEYGGNAACPANSVSALR